MEVPRHGGAAVVALFGGCGYTGSETRLGLLARLLDTEPGDVEGRQEQQGQQGRDEEAADDRVDRRS